jgi:hypothetical protein
MTSITEYLDRPSKIFISPQRSPVIEKWGLKDGEFVMRVGRTSIYADSSLSQKEVRYRYGKGEEIEITVEM